MKRRLLVQHAPGPWFSAILGRPRHLAWPVHGFRVTLPQGPPSGNSTVNPFEKVVLGVLDATGGLDNDALAEQTCLPRDLVRQITIRLRDNNLITARNVVIDHERRSWDPLHRPTNFVSAMVFRELVEGQLLPFVLWLENGSSIQTAPVNRERVIRWDSSIARMEPPSPRDVIGVITQMRLRTRAHSQTVKVPTIEQVRVVGAAELLYLDCPIAIQTRDANFRIADPFGTGFSRLLEESFDKLLISDETLSQWMSTWMSDLQRAPTPAQDTAVRTRFDMGDQHHLSYPDLVSILAPAPSSGHLSLEDIYAALEWALFYSSEVRGPDTAIRMLTHSAGPDYSPWLSAVATRLGFQAPPSGFRPIPPGKFDDFVLGKAEMDTVIAISLVQAESDRTHPLRQVAATLPDFLLHIRRLASERGGSAHGQREPGLADGPLTSEAFMRHAVGILLPDLSLSSAGTSISPQSAADLTLAARHSLIRTIGYKDFSRLGPSAQESLLSSERHWITFADNHDARRYVSDVYSALQAVLRVRLAGLAMTRTQPGEYQRQAAETAQRCGLGELPHALGQVNARRIQRTLQGQESSLGASVMALLLTADDGLLTAIAEAQPRFLPSVAEILNARGHGNEPIPMTSNELFQFRTNALTAFVTLIETSQGE